MSSSTSGFFNAFGAVINEQLPYGKIIVIKRSGLDSASFDLLDSSYLFGRSESCDIRIQIPSVSEEHCRVYWDDGLGLPQVQCLSAAGVTVHRGNDEVKVRVGESVVLRSMDVITIVERSFRYETVPNMRLKSVASLPGTPSKKPATPALNFEVQELPGVEGNGPKMVAPPAHLLSPPPQLHSAITNTGSPLKQGAVRTPVKGNPAASFVMSPLGMPAVREPLPASPLKQPAQRPGFTETAIQPSELEKTPKKSTAFTEMDITTSMKQNNTPKKTEEKVKTPIKVETPSKEESKMIIEQSEATNVDQRQQQVCTPVAQTKDLERITPSSVRLTPRPLDLDNPGVKSPALQVDHEVTTSPRLSPRVTLIDSSNGSNPCSPLQQHSKGLSPEQRELLMSPEINKIISASKPLNVLSPSGVAVDARELADVESPTKPRGHLSVQELLLASESIAMKPFEDREEQDEEFSLPITQELEQLHQRNSPPTEGFKVELVDQQIEAQVGTTLFPQEEIEEVKQEDIVSQSVIEQEQVVEESVDCLNDSQEISEYLMQLDEQPSEFSKQIDCQQPEETMQINEQSETFSLKQSDFQQQEVAIQHEMISENIVQTEEEATPQVIKLSNISQVQPNMPEITYNEQLQVTEQSEETESCEAIQDEQSIQSAEMEQQDVEYITEAPNVAVSEISQVKCQETLITNESMIKTEVDDEMQITEQQQSVSEQLVTETNTSNTKIVEHLETETKQGIQVEQEIYIQQVEQKFQMQENQVQLQQEEYVQPEIQLVQQEVIATEVNMETKETQEQIAATGAVVEKEKSYIEEEPNTPRKSSRVRKSITPLSPSRPLTPRSAKRTKLSSVVNASTKEEQNNNVTTETTEQTLEQQLIQEQQEETIHEKQEELIHEEEKETAQQQNDDDDETTLRRSTRARTPRTLSKTSARKSASTTKKRAASALKEQEEADDNSPLLRRRPMPVTQEEEEEDKENSDKRQAVEKKVVESTSANEEGASTPQRALRRSMRVSSAKK